MDRKTTNTYLLLYGLLIIFLCSLSYRMAIEPYQKLKNSVANIESMKDTLRLLNQKIPHKKTQAVISKSKLVVNGFSDLVDACVKENARIVKNKPISIRSKGDLKSILLIDIEGEYISLVKILGYIEKSHNLGSIISATYSTRVDLQQQRKYLTLRIVLNNPSDKQ